MGRGKREGFEEDVRDRREDFRPLIFANPRQFEGEEMVGDTKKQRNKDGFPEKRERGVEGHGVRELAKGQEVRV